MWTFVRMLEDYFGHPKGQILKMKTDEAHDLIEKGVAEPHEPSAKPDPKLVEAAVEKATEKLRTDYEAQLKELEEKRVEAEVKAERENAEPVKSKAATIHNVHDNLDDDGTFGFKSLGHFATEVARVEADEVPRGAWTESLKAAESWSRKIKAEGAKAVGSDELSAGQDVYGGFLIPPEFSNELLRLTHEPSVLLSRVREMPMQTDSLTLPRIEETSQVVGNLFGGVTVAWREELTQMSHTRGKFAQTTLILHELAALMSVTDRLILKSPISVEALVNEIVPEAMRHKLEHSLLAGTGAGQTLGILNAPCTVSQTAETGQAATTIVTKNVLKMFARMYPSWKGEAIWLYNPDCFVDLTTLVIEVGTAGNAVNLFNIAAAPQQTLCGKPAFEFAHCKTLGTVGDLLFVAPRQYLLGKEAGADVRTAVSIHLRFDYGEQTFRFQMLVAGQPWLSSAITPAQGSTTQSAFISLATRS